jgi:type IV secretion system protein VirD4
MAGYGLKAFLIAQSLNQIEKAYGPNNAILDNCHVRVSFATNDERPPSACRTRSAPRPRCGR